MNEKKDIIFDKDLVVFVKSDSKKEKTAGNKESEENYFKGARIKDGVTSWSTFVEEEKNKNLSVIREDKNIKAHDLQEFLGLPSKNVKIKVFFVEDNKTIQLALKTFLSSCDEIKITGFASNGKEAVEKIKKMQIPPDVILMDISMPEMNGIQATTEILKYSKVPKIIMLTAYGTSQYIIEAFSAGAIGFIRKDGGLNLIREAINQAATGGVIPIQKEIAMQILEGIDPDIAEEQIYINDNLQEEVIEMTEDEFIEEFTSELAEQIIYIKNIKNYKNYLKELLPENTLKNVIKNFLGQIEELTLSEDSTEEDFIEKVSIKLKSIILKELNK